MSLKADGVGAVTGAERYSLKADRITAADIARIVSLRSQEIAGLGQAHITQLRSALVSGLGIVNLYKVQVDGVSELNQNWLQGVKTVHLSPLSEEVSARLRAFTGDLEEQYLHILEYPDGYVLSLNNEMLAYRWQSSS